MNKKIIEQEMNVSVDLSGMLMPFEKFESYISKKILKNGSAPIHDLTTWIREFICKPNEDIGRSGLVCPFVKLAIDVSQSIFFSMEEIQSGAVLETRILTFLDIFQNLKIAESGFERFKCIVIVLPGVSDREMDVIHQNLKPLFVDHLLMLGQFYPNCNEPGLHNADFRPLRSPVPLFVIRHMQITDLPFLFQDERFLKNFCRKFSVTTAADLDGIITSYKINKLPLNWSTIVEKVFCNTIPKV